MNADLLITNGMTVASGDMEKFIKVAQDEIDSKIGFTYLTPLDIGSTNTLMPANQKTLIKSIAVRLATGRLIMGTALGGQAETVNAYGLFLIKEAESDLMAIANGQIDLVAQRVDASGSPIGVIPDPSRADPYARTPTAWNSDSTSPVTLFEKNFMTGTDPEILPWTPADNITGTGAKVDKH